MIKQHVGSDCEWSKQSHIVAKRKNEEYERLLISGKEIR